MKFTKPGAGLQPISVRGHSQMMSAEREKEGVTQIVSLVLQIGPKYWEGAQMPYIKLTSFVSGPKVNNPSTTQKLIDYLCFLLLQGFILLLPRNAVMMRIWQASIILLVSNWSATACPDACNCANNDKNVTCIQTDLAEMPILLSPRLESLTLRFNNINLISQTSLM